MQWQRLSNGLTQTEKRWRLGPVAVYGALVVVLSVVVVTSIPANRLRPVDGSGTVHAVAATQAGTHATTIMSTPTMSTPTKTTTDPDRGMPLLVPIAAEPLRVLEIGDSLGIDLGDQLQAELDTTGMVHTTVAALGDTGLANASYYDWPAHLTGLLVDDRPQILVVFIGANDDQGLYVDGAAAAPGSPSWVAGYRQRVDDILGEATSTGVRVVWVGMPPMANAELNAAVESENLIYEQETAMFPGTLWVSSTGVLGDAAGGYESTGADASGAPVSWRTEDGVHLTPAGSALLAATVIDAIDRRWQSSLRPRSTSPGGGGR